MFRRFCGDVRHCGCLWCLWMRRFDYRRRKYTQSVGRLLLIFKYLLLDIEEKIKKILVNAIDTVGRSKLQRINLMLNLWVDLNWRWRKHLCWKCQKQKHYEFHKSRESISSASVWKKIGNISLDDSPSLNVCPYTEKAIFLKLCPVLPLQKFSLYSHVWWPSRSTTQQLLMVCTLGHV